MGAALFASALGTLLIASCAHPPPPPPRDAGLDQAAGAGRQAMDLGRAGQAVEQYRQAYTLALARDDAAAIGDCGYDLAVAQLEAGDAAASVATAGRTRDALAGRRRTDMPELDLVQAAALHRLGRDGEAETLAVHAETAAGDPAVRAKASLLRGLIADDRGDAAGLAAALAAMGKPKQPDPDWQADHDHLAARLALRRGQYDQAAALALQAADVERLQLAYRDMAEALSLAATARLREGETQPAAELFLQAGESAAARGDTSSAGRWLRQVLRPDVDPAIRRAATATLATLRDDKASR